jgi:hypothetical protein
MWLVLYRVFSRERSVGAIVALHLRDNGDDRVRVAASATHFLTRAV